MTAAVQGNADQHRLPTEAVWLAKEVEVTDADGKVTVLGKPRT